MPQPRSRSTESTRRGTPADRAAEFHAEQLRLKQEAAERREQREAAAAEKRARGRARPT